MPDVEALRETMDHVLAVAPLGQHDQEIWCKPDSECGFTACFVGHRALLDGWEITWDGVRLPSGRSLRSYGDWHRFAISRFGLTGDQVTQLSDPENTLEDLKRIVDDLCDQS